MALIFHFKCTSKMLSAICFSMDQSKIPSTASGLINTLSSDNPLGTSLLAINRGHSK